MVASISNAKQPLLLQLLQEKRRFPDWVVNLYANKGISTAVIRGCLRDETRRRAGGGRALPLRKQLLKRRLLDQSEIDAALRKARASSEMFLSAAEMDALRQAQAEAADTVDQALVKLGLASEQEIAEAYAEYLHLPLASVLWTHFGDLAVERFNHRGLTAAVVQQCLSDQEKLSKAGEAVPALGAILIAQGFLTEEEVALLLDEQAQIAQRSSGLSFSADDVRSLPEKFCRDNLLVATGRQQDVLWVAVVDPSNALILEEVQHMAGMPVQLTVGTHTTVIAALNRVFGVRDAVREIVREESYDSGATPAQADDVLDLHEEVSPGQDGRIIRLANTILAGAIRERASDIHIEPCEADVRVRYRIDGILHEITPPPKAMFVPLISRLKILAKMDIAERRVAQDGSFAARLAELRVDFRVNTVPTAYGERMVMRLLNKGAVPLDLAALGFTKQQAADFTAAVTSPHGLMFVTGPTGSGKSTTLYAALQQLNSPANNILTVEDPIEYKMAGINQVQVKGQVGLTFAAALRAFLRQDPDVIMVGEVRDRETAEICLRAALTGHLVLSSLHTNDSLAAVPRLIDMGVEPFLLASTLRLLEAQRLVRRLCTDCCEPYQLDAETAGRLGIDAGVTLKRPKGCPACRGSGYRGRVGLFEVVPVSAEIASMIQTRASLPELRDVLRRAGVPLLREAGLAKAREGLTSVEEVLAITLAEEQTFNSRRAADQAGGR